MWTDNDCQSSHTKQKLFKMAPRPKYKSYNYKVLRTKHENYLLNLGVSKQSFLTLNTKI